MVVPWPEPSVEHARLAVSIAVLRKLVLQSLIDDHVDLAAARAEIE
jgi:hypothetical protein